MLTESQPLQAQLVGTQPQNRLMFEFLGRDYDLSLDLVIRAEQSGCFGASRGAWFDARDLDTFWNDVRECERTRRGEARLTAMSPADFSLRLWNTRSKGDFALAYHIGEDSRPDFDVFSVRLEGGFALEPSLLPRFVADFGALLERRY